MEADFRVFYHIADWNELDAPTFLSLALRTSAYGGVMASRVLAEQNKKDDEPSLLESTAAQKANPVLSELIEWGESG